MRCILVILAGLGDRAHKVFAEQTPLQAGYTPNLDYLATIGMNGLYHPYIQGIPMSSEIAHFLMFGYDLSDFPGRAYVEAVGAGVELAGSEVALLCRLCSVREEQRRLVLSEERPPVTASEMSALTPVLEPRDFGQTAIRFVANGEGSHFLILSGTVSAAITDSDPIYDGRSLIMVQPIDGSIEAERTAADLNRYLRWVHERLSRHPVNLERQSRGLAPLNALVTRQAGSRRALTPFFEKWGLKALSISSTPVHWGLCHELGMKVSKVSDSGSPDTDLRQRLRLAWEATDFDFIHVHTKVPGEAGQTKDPLHKRKVIESIDDALDFAIQEIIPDTDMLLAMTADNSTASAGTMIHTGETAPLTMVGQHVRRDLVTGFNEIDCAQGALGPVRGTELMHLILNSLDKARLMGLRDTPSDQPYYPGHYRPLTLDGT